MTERDAPSNAFERDLPGTHARADAEAAIERLRQRGGIFVEAVRATRMAMALTDPTLPGNPIIFANQAFLDLTGYAMDQVLGQQPYFMNGPDTDPEDAERFRRILEDDRDGAIETVQYAKGGRRFVAMVLLSAFKDDEGKTINHFLSWDEVTRRVAAESEVADLRTAQAALRESEAKYRTLFDSIDEGFCVIEMLFDDAGRPADYVFLETNPVFERQTGLVDAAGKRMRELAPEHEQHWFDIYGQVAMTGQSQRFERPAEALGRWYDVYAFRIGRPEQQRVAILFNDITDRERAGKALRESEERQAFLLKLTDALRPIHDAREIQATTARMVGEHLGADRAMYAEVEGERGAESGTIRGQYVRAGGGDAATVPFPEHFTFGQFGQHTMAARYRGEPLIVSDVQTDPAYSAEERAAWAMFGVRAAVVATYPKGGRLLAEFGVHSTTPREWPEAEVTLIKEVAERTWAAAERARAEAALRESEERNAFLVRFSDAVRGLSDPALIARESCRILTEQLGTDRTIWAVIDWEAREYVAEWVFLRDGTRGEPSRWPLDEREPFAREHLAGRPVVYKDIDSDMLIPDPVRAAMRANGLLAGIAVPVMVGGRLLAVLSTSQNKAPRLWSAGEVSFVEALAGRAWGEIERARAQAALRESEEKYRTLFETIDEGFVEMEMLTNDAGQVLDWRWLDYNSAFERMSGLKGRKGQRFSEVVPDLEPEWAERYGQVIATGEPLRFELPVSGLDSWFDVFVSRIGGAGSRRLAVVFNNITVRKRTEGALRESEERLSAAFESVPAGVAVIGQDGKVVLANGEYLRFLPSGVIPSRDLERGDRWRAWDEEGRPIAPENYPGARALRGERVIPGLDMLYTDDSGRAMWTNVATAPTWDSEGQVTGIVSVISDIDERKRSAEALADREERFRLIVENARDYAIFTTDPEGRIEQWYEGAAEVFGWSAEEAVGQLADITFTPEDREKGEPQKEREGAAREGWVPNVRWHVRKDGRRIFIEGIASALRDANGALSGFLKIGQDVTERRRADESLRESEQRSRLLLAELQHRVRNIMSMIRSIARRTGETKESVEDYVQHLQGRISAMARTQALLTRDVHAAVDLESLILDELSMQAAQPSQYGVTGPDVGLPPKAAEVLGLALHELGTNSVKYGALSEKGGRVDVRWALLEGETEPQLSLIWSESGVAIDREPSRKGFGTELVTQRVPYELRGTGTMDFRPTGLVATIEFPLTDTPSILQTDEGIRG